MWKNKQTKVAKETLKRKQWEETGPLSNMKHAMKYQ